MRISANFKVLFLALVAVFVPPAHSDTLTEHAARRLAANTLEAVEDARQALRIAVQDSNPELYRDGVILPLKRALVRWQQAPHLADADKTPYLNCHTAASVLLDMARHFARGNEARALDISLRFEATLTACKTVVYGR